MRPARLARFVPTLALVPLLALFLALGTWQWRRADERAALQLEYARRGESELALDARPRAVEDLRYRRVQVRGSWEPGHQVLIDNRVHAGRAGYHVLTPFHIAGGELRVLVNRGWVPGGPDRARTPVVDTPTGTQIIHGRAMDVPASPLRLGPEESDPRVWQHVDLARFAAGAPFPVLPVVVQLDSSSPGGFVRAWPAPDAGATKRRAYALQWFALAAALAVIYLALSMRSNRRTETE